ncbi:hypothetical protein [Shewanella algae]|uniref:hypothetical protein n=1 Tax=Shewanella algae TaxID=38313 RepID=UPI001AAFD933|nr:hypothetical protein [Shewanella algae]MBO2582527.1 hypothetical protein [Shewanella algae]
MKVIPINFNTEMMDAIIAGRKSQARLLVKPKIVSFIEFIGGSDEENDHFDFVGLRHGEWESDDGTVWGPEWLVYCTEYPEEGVVPVGSLYGAIGDQLLATDGERNTTIEIAGFRVERLQDISEQDAIDEGVHSNDDFPTESHCPKCHGQGLYQSVGPNLGAVEVDCEECETAEKRFQHLWQSIYGDESWSSNPWVWVIEFKVLTTNGVIGEEAA